LYKIERCTGPGGFRARQGAKVMTDRQGDFSKSLLNFLN